MSMQRFSGARLRRMCIVKDISVDQLAARTGLSSSVLAKFYRDEVRPSITSLGKLADALGVSVAELFADVDESSPDRRPTDLGAETDAWIQRTLATAPPMTDEQARRVSIALFGNHGRKCTS